MDVLRGRRTPLDSLPEQPAGGCGCGCNAEVPGRFVRGHQKVRRGPLAEERDCGYLTPCWVWQLGYTTAGYGKTSIAGKTLLAHRVYWERQHGPIPPGLELDHLCRVRGCVNPSHLEPVTHAENSRRGARDNPNWTKPVTPLAAAIWADLQAGMRQADAARKHRTSTGYVNQIAKGQRGPLRRKARKHGSGTPEGSTNAGH